MESVVIIIIVVVVVVVVTGSVRLCFVLTSTHSISHDQVNY